MFLGQVPLVPYPGYERLRCWRTDDGGTFCSNRKYYLPG